MRLLLDEMYAATVAVPLRGRGHDVVSVHEIPSVGGAPDDEVLAAAASQQRALVTENVRDFRLLEAAVMEAGGHHDGIVYTSNRRFPRGEPRTTGRLVRALDALLAEAPQLRNRSIFL